MKRLTRYLLSSLIVVSLLFSPQTASTVSAAADDLIVSGITTPAEANGTYTKAGTHSGYDYWTLTTGSGTYYIYNDVYSTSGGTSNYWNIDLGNMDDEGTGNVLFYSSNPSMDPTPVGLAWGADAGAGSPNILMGTPVPIIVVSGNGITIGNGATSISSGNYTNIGSASSPGGTVSRTFTIKNNGAAALTLSGSSPYVTIGGSDPSSFSITGVPSQTVAANSTTTFTVTFTAASEGYKNATITINSNDPSTGTYSFAIQGYGFTARSVVLSGLTEPTAPNGTYLHQGVLNNFQYWKHQSLNYYIYNAVFSGTSYWNIDNDTTASQSYFFIASENGTPVGLTGWTADNTVTPLPTGTPVINNAILAPEINIKGNGITIAINDDTPSYVDQTKFGSVDISAGSRTRTYTIENSGGAALTVSGIAIGGTDQADFSYTNPVPTTIPANSSTTFTATFNPSTEGPKVATISIASDDTDESTYLYHISGYAYTPKNLIVSNITTPAAANGTYLYQGILNDNQYWKHSSENYFIFYDEFSSGYYWNIDANQVDTDDNYLFFVSSAEGSPVGLTGWSANSTAGYVSAGAPIITYSGPEMDVSGNGNSIPDGSASPTTTNHTDFGAISVTSGTVSRTFTISNTGYVDLNLSGTPKAAVSGPNAADFSVTTQPTSPVTALTGTTNFTVEFNPSAGGPRTAEVSITNDDSNENPYNFTIQGTGIVAPSLTTSAAASITGTGATLGGNVSADGGATVTGRGVVYSTTNTSPTIGGVGVTQDTNGSGTGAFSEAIGGLTAATHYYYQAYAINSEGTTYGGVQEFTTLNAVTSISRAGSTPTNAASVSWTVEFGSALTGLTASNFSLANTGLTGPSITGVTGSGTTWTVTAGTGTGSGTLGLNLANDTGLSAALSNEPFTGEVYTIDREKPTVTIDQAAGQADPAGSSPVNFTVTFSKSVTGFATGDVILSASTTPGTLTGTVSGGPAVYNVAVSGMTGDGVVVASIPADAAQDTAGNTSTTSTSTDNSVAYDAVSPAVTINQAAGQSDPVNTGLIHFTAVFTEPVTGFATGGVTLTSALAGLTQTVTEIAPSDGTTYDISVGGLSGSGTVSASIAAGVATDAAARGNTASTSTDNTVTFDAVRPETTIDSHPAVSTTSTSAAFTFSATDVGTGVASFGCDLDGGGFAVCTSPRNFTGLSGGIHTFQVRAADNIGNVDATPASFIWSVDADAPSVSAFTVTSPSTSLNIPVTAFTATDDIGVTGFMVTTSSTAPAAGAAGWAALPPVTFTVAADGSYTLYPWVKDAAGRVSAVFGTPRSVTVDATAPSVTINQAVGQADPVKTGPVTFTAVFSEPVTGFNAAKISLFGSTAPSILVNGISGGPTTYTIVTTASGDGTIVLSIPTGGGLDAYSNPSADSTSTDNSVTLDSTSPTVVIDSTTPDPTNAGATVTWHSDDNGSFSVRVGGTTCANGTQVASGTYSTSPATVNSTIPSANLAAGANNLMVCVTDAAGNTGQMIGSITKVLTPIVTTSPATPVGNTTATLRGTVNANGVSTAVQFQYGLTAAYGTTVNAVPTTATGSANTNVSAALTGLTANTTYHYRVTATNANGTTDGADQTFTTTDLSINLSIHNAAHAVVTSAAVGDSLHAAAAVTHTNPTAPTGSLVFTRYNNVACYGAGTTAGTLAMAATVDPSQSAALTGNGLAFKARYAGDSNYPAVESPCASITTTTDLSILPDSTGTSPRDGVTVSGGMNSLVIQFNDDVLHNNATDGHSVLNPANFLLVSRGANTVFDTVNCAGGVVADDSQITVDSVSYNAATYTATVNVNGGTRLPAGYYRLHVCGTTSITDPSGTVFLNAHADDSRVSFRVASGSGSGSGAASGSSDPDETENIKRLPDTGFAQGRVTPLTVPPVEYADEGSLRLEIPRLGVDTSIVGVPVSADKGAWDVTWLGSDAGWLNGTAFPTFAGNSVITGHVWGADNQPGIFVKLKDMAYGDKVTVHAYGWAYTYEVRETATVAPDAVRGVIRHEDNPWVTLVTCEEYDTGSAEYGSRRVVRAVLVNVVEE